MAVNQMLPSRSATNPCAPEPGVLSGYSLILPVFGSNRPSLFDFCPVYQSDPSGATAGSWGRESGVGSSYSLMTTLGSAAKRTEPTSANARRSARRIHDTPKPQILVALQERCPGSP